MRDFIRIIVIGAALALCAAPALAANAPAIDAAPAAELGLQYNYVHTNAPPGGCGCFSMNGGGGWVSLSISNHWAAVAEVSAQHASNVDNTGQDLTLTSYLVGPRFRLTNRGRIQPFAQALLGGAHASGSFAPGTATYPGSPNAFAVTAGGGIDLVLTRHLAIRAPQVDYYLTHFDNAVNDHQNNLRISAGVVFRFGAR